MKPLERLAKVFAGDLTDLLNKTITNGIRVSAVSVSSGRCIVGYGISPRQLASKVIPVRISHTTPSAYLRVDMTMEMDRAETYLAVKQSRIGVYSDQGGRKALCHYDCDVDPPNEYPKAHLQVDGRSEAFDEIHDRCSDLEADKLGEIHFPVGGRRFRPSLEDVIEMLVVERIASGVSRNLPPVTIG